MKILLLTPQLPYPPDKGTRIRNFGLVKELARRHEVAVLSFGEPGDADARVGLEGYCRVLDLLPQPRRSRAVRALRALVDPTPDLARRLGDPAFSARLAQVLAEEPWDVLQVEALEIAPHWLAQRGRNVPPTVLDAHNAEWILQLRAARIDARAGRVVGALYSALQAAKLRRYEAWAVASADGVVAVSEADARALRQIAAPRRLAVAPNGVDTEAIQPRVEEPPGETLLFTGTMDFRPNVEAVLWFGRQVWPSIRSRLPAAHFVVAGRAPTPSVRALAAEPGIEVTGAVPDTMPLFREAALYVAPLRIGGGVRLKLLEAFAHGTPVVSTRLGAEGIDAVDGRDLVLADDAASFADAVVALLRDAPRRHALARQARRLVETKYDWRVSVPRLERLYAGLHGTDPAESERSPVASV